MVFLRSSRCFPSPERSRPEPKPTKMSPLGLQLFWNLLQFTVVVTSLVLLLSEVQAQQNSDFGWIVAGVHDLGGLPTCGYCVNLPFGFLEANRSVGMYQCCGMNYELWAYEDSTNSIALSQDQGLCLDAMGVDDSLIVSECNSSVVSQQWTWEGNRVRNGRTDSGGSLYLWWSPDLGNSSSDYNGFKVSSSQPHDANETSYASDFTFLSAKNFFDKSGRLTSEGLLLISNSPTGQIANGGFENSTYEPGASIQATFGYVDYFTLCGWVVDSGPVDYVSRGVLPPENGSYSIHLNSYIGGGGKTGPATGSISQMFGTETGTTYKVSFYFTGFPPNLTLSDIPSCDYTEALLQVQVSNPNDGTGLTQSFNSSVVDLTVQNLAGSWTQNTVVFTALSNISKISFSSLNMNSACGPMIDTVEVSPIKQPPRRNYIENVLLEVATLIAVLAGPPIIIGMIICARRYAARARENYSGLYATEHARLYSMKELSVATKNFSSVLGEGGFGTVYKADFPDGTVGAVKVEKPKGPDASSKVLALDEVAVLLRVHHRNLVNLTGFCIHQGRHLLLFEYLPNGSLYDRLHPRELSSPRPISLLVSMDSIEAQRLNSSVIPWKQRVRIAADVACGLEYLHHQADPPIVHRDIKSQNILLTTTDSAKLADFGLSKTAPVNATSFESIETTVKGSIGYLDPQYLVTGVFSPKSDVYSFGVVLLELISGHPAIYNAASVASWAAPYMTNPSLYHELVDKKLDGEFDAEELESLVDVSMLCMHADGKMRPNMQQVVALLHSRSVRSIIGTGSHRYSSLSNSIHESWRFLLDAGADRECR